MRNAELSIEVLKRYVDLYDLGDSTWNERRNLLEEQRIILEEKIKSLRESHKKLVEKIKLYDEKKLENLLDQK